ncbi:cell division transport system permease protein [Thermotomaculum hydrothermale]|uniref:Cell division protein FtsX n=1 Tax=Thermotomaculum hydrothermale TaxID=981385 RepID=A0A7R6PH82_9BACT|nr:ABC transporter permease [Thermotomaculum hydrothermale]BBB33664.1 cell division transport system permease protein [Thermotomaculum hydrothermale]
MRILSDLSFYTSEGWKNFSRSKGTTIISIFIIAVSLAIITIFSTFFVNVDLYLKRMRTEPVVSIYLKNNVSKRDINLLKNKLSLFDGVKDLKFIPKEEGLNLLYKRFSHLKGVEKDLGDNPVPDAFILKVNYKKLPELQELLIKYQDIVEDVYTPFELFSKIQSIAASFSFFAFILTFVLIISSIITIYNVIKITIVSRKEDIAIMQLVGANMRYIRMPFVFEGILQGFFGGIAGILIGNLSVVYLSSRFFRKVEVLSFLKELHILPVDMQLKLLLLSVIFGVIGALIASLQIDYT